MRPLSSFIGLALLVASHQLYADEATCGSLANPYGPYDYTNAEHRANNIPVVEQFHFDAKIEQLRHPIPRDLASNIDYTLRAVPNHHRALVSMMNLGLRDKTEKPNGANYRVECYFDRAARFRPADSTVRVIYGMFFYKHGKLDKAMEQFKEADKLRPDNANILYNLGLVSFEQKNYDQALSYAKRAYGLGFPLPGLKEKLVKAGKWDARAAETAAQPKQKTPANKEKDASS